MFNGSLMKPPELCILLWLCFYAVMSFSSHWPQERSQLPPCIVSKITLQAQVIEACNLSIKCYLEYDLTDGCNIWRIYVVVVGYERASQVRSNLPRFFSRQTFLWFSSVYYAGIRACVCVLSSWWLTLSSITAFCAEWLPCPVTMARGVFFFRKSKTE